VFKDILTEIVGRADDQQLPGILRRKKKQPAKINSTVQFWDCRDSSRILVLRSTNPRIRPRLPNKPTLES